MFRNAIQDSGNPKPVTGKDAQWGRIIARISSLEDRLTKVENELLLRTKPLKETK